MVLEDQELGDFESPHREDATPLDQIASNASIWS